MAAVNNGWYVNARSGEAKLPLENPSNIPKPIDFHKMMHDNQAAKQAYETAVHFGYSTEQCYLAVILSLAGLTDRYYDQAVKAAQLAVNQSPKVVKSNEGKDIAIL